MNHRILTVAIACLGLLGAPVHAGLGDWLKSAEEGLRGGSADSSLTDTEIGGGLKEALVVGTTRAIDYLGRPGGFLNDRAVRIKPPGMLNRVAKGLRMFGQDELVDEFETSMNRAAERAIPLALNVIKGVIREMTLQDVRRILSGDDDAATQFLRRRGGKSMHTAIKPIVAESTEKVGATQRYKALASRGKGIGLGGSNFDLDEYVTDKALDGFFLMLAKEEKNIRENPVARSTDLLKKVFAR